MQLKKILFLLCTAPLLGLQVAFIYLLQAKGAHSFISAWESFGYTQPALSRHIFTAIEGGLAWFSPALCVQLIGLALSRFRTGPVVAALAFVPGSTALVLWSGYWSLWA